MYKIKWAILTYANNSPNSPFFENNRGHYNFLSTSTTLCIRKLRIWFNVLSPWCMKNMDLLGMCLWIYSTKCVSHDASSN